MSPEMAFGAWPRRSTCLPYATGEPAAMPPILGRVTGGWRPAARGARPSPLCATSTARRRSPPSGVGAAMQAGLPSGAFCSNDSW